MEKVELLRLLSRLVEILCGLRARESVIMTESERSDFKRAAEVVEVEGGAQ